MMEDRRHKSIAALMAVADASRELNLSVLFALYAQASPFCADDHASVAAWLVAVLAVIASCPSSNPLIDSLASATSLSAIIVKQYPHPT